MLADETWTKIIIHQSKPSNLLGFLILKQINMKKLLIILSVLLLSSCCNNDIETAKSSYTWIEDKFEFEGHHYLVFYYFDYHIVHDPDCPCNNF